jgi:hypothetical protein
MLIKSKLSAMSLQIFILNRTKVDWEILTPESHLASLVLGQHPFYQEDEFNNFRNGVENWNLNLAISYPEFRRDLSRIHKKNISKTLIPTLNKIPENIDPKNVILIPMDDDDLLSPEIANFIERIFSSPEVDALTWNVLNYNLFMGKIESKVRQTTAVGYAVRLSSVSFESIMWHNIFDQEKLNLQTISISDYLGCYVRHHGSTYLLKNRKVDFANLKIDFPEKTTDIAPWCWSYLEEVEDLLIRTLRPKDY